VGPGVMPMPQWGPLLPPPASRKRWGPRRSFDLAALLLLLAGFAAIPLAPTSPSLSFRAAPRLSTDTGVRSLRVPLSSGITMECAVAGPDPSATPRRQAVVMFVHGSYHGSWCWATHWMPYLAARGVASVALNLRGTAGTPLPLTSEDTRTVPLADHVQDIIAAARYWVERTRRPLVVVAHSFGGLMALKALETPDFQALLHGRPNAPRLVGLALLASVSPRGNDATVRRTLWSRPWLTFQIAYGFAWNGVLRSPAVARAVFFNPSMPSPLVEGYMEHFREDGRRRLSLLPAELPIHGADPLTGAASWVGPLGFLPSRILVMGGERDSIVDLIALEETARFCGNSSLAVVRDAAHDLMLDSEHWREGVQALERWFRTL